MAGSLLDAYVEHTFTRSGTDRLPDHLEASYGIRVTDLTELDVGVFRVDRGAGPAWVARVFPAARPVAAAEGDADILGFLAGHDFPAERWAATPAVTVHEDQAVLVTEFLPGGKAGRGPRSGGRLGELLGRLHTLPTGQGAAARDGGAWHHLAYDGGPRAELDTMLALLAEARERIPAQAALHEQLRAELERIDDCHGLPDALIHPDFVAANAITTPAADLAMIDWAGAGRGPRLWSLAFLLWAGAGRDLAGVDAIMAGYLRHVQPEPAELARLAAVIPARPLVFACWAFCVGRSDLAAATRDIPAIRNRANAIAARAALALTTLTAAPRTTTPAATASPHPAATPDAAGSPSPAAHRAAAGLPHPAATPAAAGLPHPAATPAAAGLPHPAATPTAAGSPSPAAHRAAPSPDPATPDPATPAATTRQPTTPAQPTPPGGSASPGGQPATPGGAVAPGEQPVAAGAPVAPAHAAAPDGSASPGGQPAAADRSRSVGATGLGVAAIRAAETNRPDRLFADPLAAAFVAASGWTPPDRPPDDRVRALVAWVVARTVFLDGMLTSASQAGCHQVVLLGAGFDTRAFRLSWPPGVRLFELDSADVLDSKAQILAQQAAQPGCDRVPVRCDLREDWPGALLAAGFSPAQPTAWVAEGLLVYLDWAEVQGLIADLTELSAPDSRLGLTWTTRPPAGTSWADSLRRSTAPGDPVGWLAGHGWTAELTNPADVLAAHGRIPARPQQDQDAPPRALLVAAAR